MASTEDVLNHHLTCFGAGDMEGVLADYTEESVMEVPDARLQGLDALRAAFTAFFADFGKGTPSFEMLRSSVNGEFAYIFWKAQTEDNDYHIGSDTFVIRDGKIVYQTFAAHIVPRN
ncbi:MAG: nuclear transport factor 2 family protein [Rhodospirillales bacterium]|jgi:ketosteroid isomerase-like protein|nr:polyketide cyclase [Rhodospirillaceae bacterium]MDP6427040.1 nuclear transport factor 2 family protein [Rhodospirillales bacterium]MDP6645065.1 nuclear transport factor 2 family protein [Rhodospirillales bacterium]MDP6843224.1 nuclear transport factor 2 family protein [Rhodospirillales bacterium]|tara:strand:+ start:261 stop:611 length:351 start_codon:yes stop_codon:yes gene_type:complete